MCSLKNMADIKTTKTGAIYNNTAAAERLIICIAWKYEIPKSARLAIPLPKNSHMSLSLMRKAALSLKHK